VHDVSVTAAGRFALLFVRLVRDDAAQDIIEYALLAGFVGIAGYVALGVIGPSVNGAYATWIDPTRGSPKLWEPADPWVSAGS